MSSILYSLPLLACPVGMGLMMWLMMRGNKKDGAPAKQTSPVAVDETAPASVELLREEHRRLGEHIERLEGVKSTETNA